MNVSLRGIDLAIVEMTDAASELERVLEEMNVEAPAEKIGVSPIVEAALDRLRAAQAAVAELSPRSGSGAIQSL